MPRHSPINVVLNLRLIGGPEDAVTLFSVHHSSSTVSDIARGSVQSRDCSQRS